MEYTLKYCNMYLMLGGCGNRANGAVTECVKWYLAHQFLNANVFCQLDQRMRDSGNVLPMPSMDRGQ